MEVNQEVDWLTWFGVLDAFEGAIRLNYNAKHNVEGTSFLSLRFNLVRQRASIDIKQVVTNSNLVRRLRLYL
jgi:hypothetical protein